MSKAQ